MPSQSDVIHASDPFFRCENFAQAFLKSLPYATGAFLNNMPLVCGGIRYIYNKIDMSYTTEIESGCYSFGSEDPVVKMSVPRYGAAGILIENGKSLWVTGGTNVELHRSTDFIQLDPPLAQPGPDLPVAMGEHCLIQLKNGTFLMIGGGGKK